MVLAPDLLFAEPRLRQATTAVEQALTFAFTTGGSQRALEDACGVHPGEESLFRAASFESGLFLSDLVERCFPIPKDCGERPARTPHIVRVLSAPPSDLDSVLFRQGITRELADDATLRVAAHRSYRQLTGLWQLLEASYIGQRLDPVRRRVEIVRAVVDIVEALPVGFGAARSGLRRVAEWADDVRRRPAYVRLVEFLEHEGRAGVVDLSVQVGRDGELRRFEIVRVERDRGGPLQTSPVRRFLARLSLWLFGYRIRQDEILSRLVNSLFEGVQAELLQLFRLLGDLEVYLGALGFSELAVRTGMSVCVPEVGTADGGVRRIHGLFNPFLLLQRAPPTPCDVELGAQAITILTGPNSGGKTRLVQALGICQLLAQNGLFVPAASARLPLAEGLFVSLSAETRADQEEGSLGTELLRIRQVFEELAPGGMVILDELCSGTNPSEGEEIFELVVELLCELGAQAFITTHFLKFAARLEKDRPVAALAFLQAELDARDRPTYHFVPGVASTSLAAQTARRLGVTREELHALIQKKKANARPGKPAPVGAPPEVTPLRRLEGGRG